jgi:hypothetical protein
MRSCVCVFWGECVREIREGCANKSGNKRSDFHEDGDEDSKISVSDISSKLLGLFCGMAWSTYELLLLGFLREWDTVGEIELTYGTESL